LGWTIYFHLIKGVKQNKINWSSNNSGQPVFVNSDSGGQKQIPYNQRRLQV